MAFYYLLLPLLILITSCIADVANARSQYLPPSKGYNYDRPEIPFDTEKNTQRVPFPTTTKRPTYTTSPGTYPTQSTYRPQPTPGHHEDHHHHHEPGMPFDFNYAVKDDYFGNDYSHNAISDGDVTRGEYKILLPDGRTQVAKYTADWRNGFNVKITYEGTPTYPVFGASGGKSNQGYKY